MNHLTKTISSVTFLSLLGLAICPDAIAGSVPISRGTDKPIETCVAEIRKHADYVNASRVVHQISKLDQHNFIEMEMTVDTVVYLKSDDGVAREYTATCVTGIMGDLLEFRIDAVGPKAS